MLQQALFRNYASNFVVIGGDFSESVYLYPSKTALSPLPVGLRSTGAVSLNGRIHIVGIPHIETSRMPLCFWYDIVRNAWEQFQSPPTRPVDATVVGIGGCLFVIGGCFESDVVSSTFVDHVWRLDLSNVGDAVSAQDASTTRSAGDTYISIGLAAGIPFYSDIALVYFIVS